MLDKAESDTEVVRIWLTAALSGKDSAGRRAALARHCGVSSQAVSGWLKTGRITKTNLEQATAFFGHGPSFTKLGSAARQPTAAYLPPAPPPPPPDFSDRRLVSDSDWDLLQDVKTAATPEELAAIRERAAIIERKVAERLAAVGAAADPPAMPSARRGKKER